MQPVRGSKQSALPLVHPKKTHMLLVLSALNLTTCPGLRRQAMRFFQQLMWQTRPLVTSSMVHYVSKSQTQSFTVSWTSLLEWVSGGLWTPAPPSQSHKMSREKTARYWSELRITNRKNLLLISPLNLQGLVLLLLLLLLLLLVVVVVVVLLLLLGRKTFTTLKVPWQCPLVLLVHVVWKEG